MNVAVALLAPLLLPVAGAIDQRAAHEYTRRATTAAGPIAAALPPIEILLDDRVQQVRIEEHFTIRIVPRTSRLESELLLSLPTRASPFRLTERRIGRCLPIARIAGVQPNRANELILFMRDRSVVSGLLERACRARDFYSGFYLARNTDGKLCVDRDLLLSRSGANCRLTQIRRLVAIED